MVYLRHLLVLLAASTLAMGSEKLFPPEKLFPLDGHFFHEIERGTMIHGYEEAMRKLLFSDLPRYKIAFHSAPPWEREYLILMVQTKSGFELQLRIPEVQIWEQIDESGEIQKKDIKIHIFRKSIDQKTGAFLAQAWFSILVETTWNQRRESVIGGTSKVFSGYFQNEFLRMRKGAEVGNRISDFAITGITNFMSGRTVSPKYNTAVGHCARIGTICRAWIGLAQHYAKMTVDEKIDWITGGRKNWFEREKYIYGHYYARIPKTMDTDEYFLRLLRNEITKALRSIQSEK